MKYLLLLALLALVGCAEQYQDVCSDDYLPVCGSDGYTYINACVAGEYNVSIAYQGACEPISQRTTQTNESNVTNLNSSDTVCTMEYDPVCGTDGATYGNRCIAEQNKVAIDYEGECDGRGGSFGTEENAFVISAQGIDMQEFSLNANEERSVRVSNTRSSDVVLSIPQMGIQERIAPGESANILIPASRPGIYSVQLNYAQVGTIRVR